MAPHPEGHAFSAAPEFVVCSTWVSNLKHIHLRFESHSDLLKIVGLSQVFEFEEDSKTKPFSHKTGEISQFDLIPGKSFGTLSSFKSLIK